MAPHHCLCAHVLVARIYLTGWSDRQDDPTYEGAETITEEDVAWAAAERQMLLEVCGAEQEFT